MERDNWRTRFAWRVRNEPVRIAEEFRVLLFAIPAVLNFAVDDLRLTAGATVVSTLLSWYASTQTRSVVSPVAKLEEDLTYDDEFKGLVENYG